MDVGRPDAGGYARDFLDGLRGDAVCAVAAQSCAFISRICILCSRCLYETDFIGRATRLLSTRLHRTTAPGAAAPGLFNRARTHRPGDAPFRNERLLSC